MKKAPTVLIVRLSSLGDIVLTTPVVRCLKLQLGARIHYVVKEQCVAAIVNNPHVDQVHVLKKGQAVREIVDELAGIDFDHVIDLHHNLRSWMIKRGLSAPSSAFPKLNMEKWLMVNFRINRLPDLHIVDRYMQAAEPLGVHNDGQGLEFALQREDRDFARAQALEWGLTGYYCIALAASKRTRYLEMDQLLDLLEQVRFPAVLLGGPEDAETGAALEARVPHVFNLAGKATLGQSAAMLASAKLQIAPDTILTHLAAALDIPMIMYWGNTIPQFGMTPYYRADSSARLAMMEVPALPCRPCSKIGYDKCPKRHFKCIRQLNIAEMAATANIWMQVVKEDDEVPSVD